MKATDSSVEPELKAQSKEVCLSFGHYLNIA